MTLVEMISHRKSCRSFTGVPVDAEMIEQILSFDMKPLYPEIKVRMDIVGRNQVRCLCPWTTPQVITIYSEDAPGYLENVGFLFQQLDLYLQTLGLGVCWLGMGKLKAKTAPDTDGMKFVIMLAFGHPKGDPLRRNGVGFKRKTLAQISDSPDPKLEPARLAPSSVNSQPWYFTHKESAIHTFCTAKGLASEMNRIDIGIALAHLYVANPETFRLISVKTAPAVPGYGYVCSFTLEQEE